MLFSSLCHAQKDEIKIETHKIGDRTFTYHIQNGDTITIEKMDFAGVEFYKIKQGKIEGCMDMNKNVIIPLSRGYTAAYPQKLRENYPVTYQIQKDGYSGVCDASGNEMISPNQHYKGAFYTQSDNGIGYFYVTGENNKVGICDMSGKEIIPTQYEIIIYDDRGFSVCSDFDTSEYKETGIVLNSNGIASKDAINRQKQVEDDGFIWYKLYKNGVFGAESAGGKTIIPLSRKYTDIYYQKRKDGKKGYFECMIGEKEGICTIDGTEIIAPKYESVFFWESEGFSVRKNKNGKFEELNIMLADNGLVKKEKTSTHRHIASNKRVSNSHNHSHGNNRNTPKSQRIQNMNGYTDIIPQGNGTSLIITHQVCFHCKGTRMCSLCGGRGGITHPYLGTYIACTNCMSSGRCKYCRGTGEQVFQSVVDSQGNGYNVDMNGNVVTSGGSGGGYDSSGNSSKSSSNSNSKDYIETIEYSPNYTGKDNSEWCDICKKVAPAHKHIKKRY